MPTDPRSDRSDLEESDGMPLGPFLGRRSQLAQLCRAVEEARAGRGARFWLVGPHRIGKSRLLAEIARYAAWRSVPVEVVDAGRAPQASPAAPGLLVLDPVAPTRVATADDALRRAAELGALGFATSTSHDRCVRAGIPASAIVPVGALDPADSLRLLGAWLGSELDPVWARRTVGRTHGHPGRMRVAARHFLTGRRGPGPPGGPAAPLASQ